jgi:hypothetical protein
MIVVAAAVVHTIVGKNNRGSTRAQKLALREVRREATLREEYEK